ncbi:MAG: class I SAM-dependent DNA methyltransferase [Anaerolineae bacterium]
MTGKRNRVAAYYNNISAVYDTHFRREHDLIDRREKEIFEREIGGIEGERVLDFGCGTGRFALYLLRKNPRQVLGVDISPGMIAAAAAAAKTDHPAIAFRVYNPQQRQTPFNPHAPFSLITCLEVIEYQPDPQEFFTVVQRNLKPGGRLFFDFINRANPMARLKARTNKHWIKNGVQLYTAAGMRRLCRANNIAVKGMHGVHMLLLPKSLLSKRAAVQRAALRLDRLLDKLPALKYLLAYRIVVVAARNEPDA